ncbi:hypothetical protein GIB67_026549 [Kingdonia uniflora]|uniref:Ubiquinone biosynthesis protein n=1 Tax=Kingdonia uniflora TaxID=39325 RepID=A0A7J7PC50_9MAGN|nr:hypothetical protein GIB67_026549 [Kingdonia uniflora]
MYRSVLKRLLLINTKTSNANRRFLPQITTFSTKTSSFSHQNHPSPQSILPQTLTSNNNNQRKYKSDYQEDQVRVLQASLRHVVKLGWSEAAMISGARKVGVSPSVVGSFPRKEAALVEFFMDDCLQRLIDRIDSGEELKDLIYSERVAKLVQIRLEMQVPFISKWSQALSIQAQPMNVPMSFKQRAMLVDEIWHACGDNASNIDWYLKRTVLGGLYSTTEIYMLTDNSPGFHDTWEFVRNRVKDAFDLGKTVQEATYLAEAVGAGLGSSLAGFVKGVSRG